MSMGVQDFELQVQAAVNRIQPEWISRQVLYWARELGFASINIDLMYGLPHQTADSFERTIRTVISYDPDRIAVFNYAHVPWLKPHQKLIHQEDMPTPEAKLEHSEDDDRASDLGGRMSTSAWIILPNRRRAGPRAGPHAVPELPGLPTKAGADLYGFGMSSISNFQNIYAQNTKVLPEYYRALDAGTLQQRRVPYDPRRPSPQTCDHAADVRS